MEVANNLSDKQFIAPPSNRSIWISPRPSVVCPCVLHPPIPNDLLQMFTCSNKGRDGNQRFSSWVLRTEGRQGTQSVICKHNKTNIRVHSFICPIRRAVLFIRGEISRHWPTIWLSVPVPSSPFKPGGEGSSQTAEIRLYSSAFVYILSGF